jgi:hypothetical protein
MPDPWPGMVFEGEGDHRPRWIVQTADYTDLRGWVVNDHLSWSPEFVREVRSATGEVLWRRDE